MRGVFYPRLALDGIRKNRQMYLPYVLTCIGMVTLYYILMFLSGSEYILALAGGASVGSVMSMGAWLCAVFCCIFLFYTNSFLIRRRKKEFGLYNILGMGKRSISRILVWETLILFLLSLALGLAAGIALSKLFELVLARVMRGEVNFSVTVSKNAVINSCTVFGAVFLLLLLNSVRQVRFSSAAALLRGENVGEKPPRGNWLIGLVGVLLLGVGYRYAVVTENPLSALLLFFVAAAAVIVGTYMVMISGSVFFCRVLKRKKSFYYNPRRFVSISQMVYRMKRNGAGLASICILATMVLVMLSATSCLYFGGRDALYARYPREVNIDLTTDGGDIMESDSALDLRGKIEQAAALCGGRTDDMFFYRAAEISGIIKNGVVETDPKTLDNAAFISALENLSLINFMPLEDYNAITGKNETLQNGQALICKQGNTPDIDGRLSFNGGGSFEIKKRVESFGVNGMTAMAGIPATILIVPNLRDAVSGLDALADYNGNRMMTFSVHCGFDTGLPDDARRPVYNSVRDFCDGIKDGSSVTRVYFSVREDGQREFYGILGGFYYVGILLSLLFIAAAVLIIYYKQISEGYEDRARFEIMQKVGMTKKEIRRSINSQILTVFFLPLLLACVHLGFCFPMLRRLLMLFNINNLPLSAAVTVICLAAFALFYAAAYKLTSNAYYKIVSGAESR